MFVFELPPARILYFRFLVGTQGKEKHGRGEMNMKTVISSMVSCDFIQERPIGSRTEEYSRWEFLA